jgi:ABC transport system ATP-binding/permease protein
MPASVAVPASAPVAEPSRPAAPRRLTFKERRELESIESLIAAAESRAESLQAQLNDPGIYKSRAAEVPAVIADLDATRAEVERLYARWQELEALPR